jgi:DNA-binding response OmpR family regulator
MNGTAGHLLVVDDDSLIRATYKHCFEQAGFSVGLASNGNQAISYLCNHEVGTVFLDVFMPDKEGLETLLEIKKRFSGVRVIVMTGGSVEGSPHDFLAIATKFGADGVIRKPFSPEAIVKMLTQDSFRASASS